MKKTFTVFTVILLLASCNRDKQSESDEMATMYPAPKTVVFNLLSNSAKFTPTGGSIETTTWKKGKELFVCVTDTGIGLKKENLEKVFVLPPLII